MLRIITPIILLCYSCDAKISNENVLAIPEFAFLDESIDPCDNFYEFSCGNFKHVHPLPKKQRSIDNFGILQDETYEDLKHALNSPIKDEDSAAFKKAKIFYTSCINESNSDGIFPPSMAVLDYFKGWPLIERKRNVGKKMTWEEIGDAIAYFGIPLFFNIDVLTSNPNGTSYIIRINNPLLTITNSEVIGKIPEQIDLSSHERLKRKTHEQNAFHVFLRRIAIKMRRRLTTRKGRFAIYLEIADCIKLSEDISARLIDNDGPTEVTIKKLQEWTDLFIGKDSGMNWLEFLGHVFKNTGIVLNEDMQIQCYSSIFTMLNLYKKSDSDTIKNYIIARILTNMAQDSERFMRNSLRKYHKANGRTIDTRPKYCLSKVLGGEGNIAFGNPIIYEYQKYLFNGSKLDKAREVIHNIRDSFLDIIDRSTWMDTFTKQNAKLKASKMTTVLEFDEETLEKKEEVDEFYDDLQVFSGDHFGNSRRLNAFNLASNLKQVRSKKKHELWSISPFIVNAFYDRKSNEIVLPASILQPPFFYGNHSILDYARIGTLIGHEITHGFDDAGRLLNANGSLEDWWSEESEEAFRDHVQCFKEQYGNYYVDEIDEFVDGDMTLNENIADNGGLHIAYNAMQKLRSTTEKTAIGVKGYTPEQLFFIGFGTMWCTTESYIFLEMMHLIDVHSLGRTRVTGGVSNMEEFADAFNCPKNSKMNPDKKCLLW